MLKTGLTSRTVQSLQLNAGVLLRKAYTEGMKLTEDDIVCATRGGGSFTAVQEIHQVAVDGAPTYTKGMERVDGWTVTLSTTALEFTPKALKVGLGFGANVTNETGTDTQDSVITGHTAAHSEDYQDYWWVGDLSDGRNVVIHIKNAVNTSGLNITFTDKGEGTFSLALIGHYTAEDIMQNKCDAPFEITIMKKAAAAMLNSAGKTPVATIPVRKTL